MKSKRKDNVKAETRRYVFVLVIVVAICSYSCSKNKRRDEVVKILSEWTGKEVRFPQGISCTSIGKDTTCIDLFSDNFKILLYVDSIGCTSCRLTLSAWKKIMQESDSVFIRKPEFVFFFHPKRRDEQGLQFIFIQNGFSHPVFIDKENEIGKLNKFPSNPEYQCFLLDRDNKVVMVGDPSLNTGVWALYKRVISERETRVLTMEKGEDFFKAIGNTTLPPYFPLIKKGGSKSTKLI